MMQYGSNPAGGGISPARAPESLTPEFITERVDAFQADHSVLFARMDADLERFELKPYNANEDGTDTFPSYTSNAPRTFAKKIVSLLASSELFVKVPYATANRDERDKYDMKERFFYGLLQAADDRLRARLELGLKSQICWFAALRGYICIRAILGKNPSGATYVELMPLDPRNAAWEVGYEGLEWAAYSTQRSAASIESQYGIKLGGLPRQLYTVIDYYEKQFNAVVVKSHGFIKPPTPHGAVGVPIIIVPVGPGPEIQTPFTNLLASSSYGESIYAENRGVYESRNQILSIYLALVKKSRDRSYVLYSLDGVTTLQDNPNEAAGVIPLPSSAKLDLVGLAETTKDAAILAGAVSEEMHFGSLSKTSYGDVPFQLSGFAINSLRQSVFSILHPLVTAVQDATGMALNAIYDQYQTKVYDTISLAGYGNNRAYFNQAITPESIANLPSAVVKMESDLPQDNAGNMAIANQARTPDGAGVPLLPDVDILERILKVQDVGATVDAVKEQQAERASPRALAYSLMLASENRDRPDLASIWFNVLLIEQLQERIKLGMAKMQVGQVEAQVGQGATPPGLSTGVLPGAAQGKPPPTPTPQGGANVPASTPRPGAAEPGPGEFGE